MFYFLQLIALVQTMKVFYVSNFRYEHKDCKLK